MNSPAPLSDHVVQVDVTRLPGVAIIATAELRAKVTELVLRMGDLPEITNQESFDAVRKVVKDARSLERAVDACKRLARAPYLAIADTIDDLAVQYLEPLRMLQLEGKAQEHAFILDRDARLAELAILQAKADAEALLDTSRPTPAITVIEQPEALVAPVSYHDEMEILDASIIPDEYWVLDLVKLRREALAGKNIPGVTVKKVGRLNSR